MEARSRTGPTSSSPPGREGDWRPEAGLALPVLRPQVEKEIGGQKKDWPLPVLRPQVEKEIGGQKKDQPLPVLRPQVEKEIGGQKQD